MYRPNRIGPWPCADIEIPPWLIGDTPRDLIDNGTIPVVLAGVRSITVPTISNSETIALEDTFTPTKRSMWALGVLISGVNPDPTNNIMYSVSGAMYVMLPTAETEMGMHPIISKLDATPSDADAAITITDYTCLPCQSYHMNSNNIHASVNTQVIVGDIRGSTASQSNLPIFVGWMFFSEYATAYNIRGIGSINVHKYLEDIKTQDPWR